MCKIYGSGLVSITSIYVIDVDLFFLITFLYSKVNITILASENYAQQLPYY